MKTFSYYTHTLLDNFLVKKTLTGLGFDLVCTKYYSFSIQCIVTYIISITSFPISAFASFSLRQPSMSHQLSVPLPHLT